MDIAHAVRKRQVGLNLPGITDVPLNSVIRSQAAGRQSESRLLRRKSLAVAHDHSLHRVIERIWICASRRLDGRAQSQELCEPAALDMVIAKSVTQDMRTEQLAAVVLDLVVALVSLLGRQ